ncbi:MAG: hypothetical protein NC235_07650 [Clostridiales bacterium]|nr:hypothetical protein [Clostridiales bacterium]MCM1576968.1 hypothetical protein [Bacteroides sp.]
MEQIRMALNGKDLVAYNLIPLQGCIATLISPPTYKKLATNDNAALHGSTVLSSPTNRWLDKRDISLSFLLRSPSFVDLQRNIDNLVDVLVNGVNKSGVNELYVPALEKTYRLVFVSIDRYTNFGLCGDATINIKFTEPNPNNRK